MPNWCENTLSIKGTKEQIVDFNKRYLPNGTFSFENVISHSHLFILSFLSTQQMQAFLENPCILCNQHRALLH